MKTVTIIGAWSTDRWTHGKRRSEYHCKYLAQDLGRWLAKNSYVNVGFTVYPSYGGGAGWDTEPGFVLIFAGIVDETATRQAAEWVRQREKQTAVAYLAKDEAFTLVSA